MPRNPHLHLRMTPDQHQGLADLATTLGSTVPDVVRELVALAVAAGSLTPLRAAVFPQRYPVEVPAWAVQKKNLPTVPTPTGCTHPTTAHRREPFRVMCGLCGGVVRVTS